MGIYIHIGAFFFNGFRTGKVLHQAQSFIDNSIRKNLIKSGFCNALSQMRIVGYTVYMEFYQLRQLIAFAECGNLSKAAETVHTSQSALSRSMKNLEAELDVPLFMRTKNSISLTETGILAAERAKNVVSAHDDMILSVREAERKRHNFSFGSIAPAPIWNLTPILSEIFPGKTVNSDLRESETELIQGLDDGTYNLIVLLRPIEKKYRRKGAF